MPGQAFSGALTPLLSGAVPPFGDQRHGFPADVTDTEVKMYYLVVLGQPIRNGGFHDFELAEKEAWKLLDKEQKQVDIIECLATFTPRRKANAN